MSVTDFAERGPKTGIDPKAVEALGRLLHDEAIGCQTHEFPHRPQEGFTVDRVHQHDALMLLRAIQRTNLRLTDGAS